MLRPLNALTHQIFAFAKIGRSFTPKHAQILAIGLVFLWFKPLLALPMLSAVDCLNSFNASGQYTLYSDNAPIRYGIYGNDNATNGTILFLMGRGDFIEKYCDHIIYLNEQGFRVMLFDWRGMGYSVRQLPNPQKIFVNSFEDYIKDSLKILNIAQKLPKPLYMLSYDLGGNIGLRLSQRFPDLFEKIVFISPLWDMRTNRFLRNLPEPISSILGKDEYIIGDGDFNSTKNLFEENLETTNKERFERTLAIMELDHKLKMGGKTYGWLNEALKSFIILRNNLAAAPLNRPVLLISAKDEQIVPSEVLRANAQYLTRAELLEVDGRHDILQERDEVLDPVMQRIVNFYRGE